MVACRHPTDCGDRAGLLTPRSSYVIMTDPDTGFFHGGDTPLCGTRYECSEHRRIACWQRGKVELLQIAAPPPANRILARR